MDYINSHHMWQPLAAISFNSNYKKVTTTTMEIPSTRVPNMDDDTNDVWHKIIFDTDSNSIFNRLNETEVNMTVLTYNSTSFGNYSISNETNYSQDVTWHLVTMIGTAVILGLLILATVIVFYRKVTTTTMEIPSTRVPNMDDDTNDVWHKIIFDTDSNSIFNRLNETEVNMTVLTYNSTSFGNYSISNETNYSQDVTWHLVTMIGTAVILGLLILATVIGKSITLFYFQIMTGTVME
ncbi:hypothetical protein FQA39_LY07997 [Lamprigera yunnana]|nr:hypothetical protein FQA39_LY07997 [Lamprigera yunnana]